jgi:hypothetical protein
MGRESIQQCRSLLPWRSHPEIDRPTLHPVSIAAYAYLMQPKDAHSHHPCNFGEHDDPW